MSNSGLESEKVLRIAKRYHRISIFLLCFLCLFYLGVLFIDQAIGCSIYMLLCLLAAGSWMLPTQVLCWYISISLRQQHKLMQEMNRISKIVERNYDLRR